VGIDEAGYGPNLGPMVMTAVVAEATDCGRGAEAPGRGCLLDFWGDLAGTVARAGGDPARLWVDDSKAIWHGGKGRDRLEAACLAAIAATGMALPGSITQLLAVLGAGSRADGELSPWFDADGGAEAWPWIRSRGATEALLAQRPLVPGLGTWRLAAIHSVVVGPARFNAELAALGGKSHVHFAAFARLLRRVWDRAGDGAATFVIGDKHGGRHYYLGPLSQAFADAWIDRGPEGADSSRYTLRDGGRRLELSLVPRADRHDGLVALASMVSKTVRELWMDGFNAYWRARVPGLRPSAGYPVDAHRFRRAIESLGTAAGCDPASWWRRK
jgi:hypothetical protein